MKNFINFYDYWHGIPEYLKAHGYEIFEVKTNWRGRQNKRLEKIKRQLDKILQASPKIHIFAHSLGTLDTLLLSKIYKDQFESLTLISPPFGGSPWADLGKYLLPWLNDALTNHAAEKILNNFEKQNIYITTVVSNPEFELNSKLKYQHKILEKYLKSKKLDPRNDGLVPLISQMIAKEISDKLIVLPGDHVQVIGAGPWPKTEQTAHEFYLKHCIFLAERDLESAK
ncbi:MAG: hypothetical protein IPM57_02665 [Oligoflexia bacterium]|nr:hypothetical protein [Oligoflexia bacterium]